MMTVNSTCPDAPDKRHVWSEWDRNWHQCHWCQVLVRDPFTETPLTTKREVIAMAKETQESISEWAQAVFGDAGSDARVATRANEEMAELLRAVTSDAPIEKVIEEAADVVIVLYRLANRNGFDLHEAINQKMEINRAREWKKDGTGHGYHIRVGKAGGES